MKNQSRRVFFKNTLMTGLGLVSIPFLSACGDGDEFDLSIYPVRTAKPETPILASMNNFRDFAGSSDESAYRSKSGLVVQRDLLYRSNEISPSDADLQFLNSLGISKVYDLRTPGERQKKPNRVLNSAEVREINILDVDNVSIDEFNASTPEEMVKILVDYNEQFILDEGLRSRTGSVIKEIMQTNGVQLVHCTAGKDRTGWISALLLLVLGVPDDVVIEDFLQSNDYMQAQIERNYQYMRSQDESYANAMRPALGVVREVMVAGIEKINKNYGGIEGFFKRGMGVSDDDIKSFRIKMLRRL